MPRSGLTMDQVQEFLRYQKLEKRCSAHTLRAYATDLQAAGDFRKDKLGVETPFAEAGYPELRAWSVS